jgi:hypothetical protein
MTKILKSYENLANFEDFSSAGKLIRVIYKDTTKPDDLFYSTGKFGMRPGEAPVNHYKLMGTRFETIEDAISYSNPETQFSVNAFDGLRFEILDVDQTG